MKEGPELYVPALPREEVSICQRAGEGVAAGSGGYFWMLTKVPLSALIHSP